MKSKSETDEAVRELLELNCSQGFSRSGLLLRREGSRRLLWASHSMSAEPAAPRDPGLQAIEISPFDGSCKQAYYVEFSKQPFGVYELFFEPSGSFLSPPGIALLMDLASLAQSCFWTSCSTALFELLQAQKRIFSQTLHRGLAQDLTIARLEFGLAGSDQDASERFASALDRCAEQLRSLLHDRLRGGTPPQDLKLRLFELLKVLSNLAVSGSEETTGREVSLAKRFVCSELMSVWFELDGTIKERYEDSYEFCW